ncbi:MAG: glycosyl hydrolase [Limisphaerales bacterium]
MTYSGKLGLIGALSLFFLVGTTTVTSAADDALAWPALTAQTRPWVWWWWHGSAVDKTNLTHELQRFHDAGLGGVQFTPIFGVKGGEAQDISYLSPKWMAMMGYTVDEARRLGMGADMTLGTGWCFGGPTVSDQDANASVVVKTFDVATGGKLEEKFDRHTTQALVAFSPDGKSVELTDKISADGTADWTAPVGSWNVYAISQKPSGQKVKRPAPGGEGWMLNPIYPQAMRDWLPWFDQAFAGYTGAKPGAVFQDSYEYRSDWSPDFFAQFEKLRGYKLQTELPALFGSNEDDHAARVKSDYRETVSDIMAEQSEPAWIDWAHKNGFSTIYQAHGTPGNWLDLYADADVPETEMFHNDRSVLISKFASSAAHTQGRELTGAETGTWLKEHFTETLADVKYLADDMFLSGINHIFYHGACYSPDAAPWPGWVFYASTEMNPRNSIWHDVPALNEYVARCQAVLQSGKSDNDILLYWPISDFWHNPSGRLQPMTVSQTGWFEDQPIGKTAHGLWNRGYAFDYVSDRQLQTAKVKNGEVQMPGGNYKVIVVPPCKYIPLETFKKLVALAENGATVIFEKQLPAEVSGWGDLEKRQAEFRTAYDKVVMKFPEDSSQIGKSMASIGKGQLWVGKLEWLLDCCRVPREMLTDAGFSFVRRSFDGGWYYFIANRGEKNFDGWVTLGRTAKSVVILDPITGNSGVAASRQSADSIQVRLQLQAGESAILRAFANQEVKGPAWNYLQTNGQPVEITGSWDVKFIAGGPVLPAPFSTTNLASWTELGDTNTQSSFVGTALYTLTFDAPGLVSSLQAAPDTLKREHQTYFLDLGKVCQSARVRVNGKDYGTLITPPFRVVADNLKPTGNQLEVEVTSVSANRIRDLDRRGVPWKIFKDINIVNVNYRPFNAADWPLTDCGLLGPVTLTGVSPLPAGR